MADSFWTRVDKSGDCWVWTGRRFPTGYGNPGGHAYAHRVSWEDNAQDRDRKGRDAKSRGWKRPVLAACLRGHAKAGDNLVIRQGDRFCRICLKASAARARQRRRVQCLGV